MVNIDQSLDVTLLPAQMAEAARQIRANAVPSTSFAASRSSRSGVPVLALSLILWAPCS
ncbi:hypothetical protein [Micromonospora sp. KC213]|uniref:hypothetical protein n=1 Tax=Micromonospora sp. KC213 TaxID=2530378 RepID=UPI0014053380|nr:hypothetical protein [Micromonospora sp. KC213]